MRRLSELARGSGGGGGGAGGSNVSTPRNTSSPRGGAGQGDADGAYATGASPRSAPRSTPRASELHSPRGSSLTRGRASSQDLALMRRRAQSDYLNTERFETVKGAASASAASSAPAPQVSPRSRFRTSSNLAGLARSRSATGTSATGAGRTSTPRHNSSPRHGEDAGAGAGAGVGGLASLPQRPSSVRLSKRKSSSINPVDLSVLDSMQLPEEQPHDHDAEHDHVELTLPKDAARQAAEAAAAAAAEAENEGCLICMGKFTAKRPSMQIPCSKRCNLAPVHAKCIYEWKEQKKGMGTCPLCRSDLGEIPYRPPDLLQLNTLVMFNARKLFAQNPVPKGAGMLRCYVKAFNGFWGSPVQYELYIQAPTTLRYPLGVLPSASSPDKGDRLLLTARKRLTKWGSSVIDISLDCDGADFRPASPNYLGAMHASTSGLEHTLVQQLSKAAAAALAAASGGEAGGAALAGQRELLSVIYTQNRVGSASGPRRMTVALPRVREVDVSDQDPAEGIVMPRDVTLLVEGKRAVAPDQSKSKKTARDSSPLPPPPSAGASAGAGSDAHDGAGGDSSGDNDDDDDDEEEEEEKLLSRRYVTEVYRPANKNDSLISTLRRGKDDVKEAGLYYGVNKEPYWLDSIQAYSLDFQGRVTLPSNKNFQLELDFMREAIALQFGKVVGADEELDFSIYTVDVQWPLSPLQALGLALTACDRKALCA
jgi:hypothetical protein